MGASGARLHAKAGLCAGLAFGRSLRVAPSGCVSPGWFEDTNSDVNGRRCAEGIVRPRGRCLGTVGLQSAKKVSEVRCEHKEKRCGCGLFDTS